MTIETLCMGCMEDKQESSTCPNCGWREGEPAKSPLYLPPRTRLLDKYIVGRVLGYGGFGITYMGFDVVFNRKVAIKEYMPNGLASRTSGELNVTVFMNQARNEFDYGLEQFLEEGRTVARFQYHPGIVKVLDFVRTNGTAYLVMEFLPGQTFEEYLHKHGDKIEFDAALNIMTRVMDALREVHKEGILHRDVSPDNVFLLQDGSVKLFDFGAARQAFGQRSRNLSVILKEGYAPVEQYSSKGNQGPWTDVYAASATFYRAVTGKVPPPSLDRNELDEIAPPLALGAKMPALAQDALMKAMAVRVPDRTQSMEAFQAALTGQSEEVFLDSRTKKLLPGSDPFKTRKLDDRAVPIGVPVPKPVSGWRLKAGIGAAAVVLIAGVWKFTRPTPGPDTGNKDEGGVKVIQVDPPPPSPPKPVPRKSEPVPPPVLPPPAPGPATYDNLMNQAQTVLASNVDQAVALTEEARKTDPSKPRAYDMLAFIQMYYRGNFDEAGNLARQAIAKGGHATFRVVHDIGDGSFSQSCQGFLSVFKSKVTYASTQCTGDAFESAFPEIREAKANKAWVPKSFSVGRHPRDFNVQVGAKVKNPFHIRTAHSNYNLAGTSRAPKSEMDLILALLGK